MSNIPRIVQAGRDAYARLSDEVVVNRYFALYHEIEEARKRKDFRTLLHGCVGSLPFVERYSRWFQESASGNPVQVPAIYNACRFLPITGARGQLENILELVEFLPEIRYYREGVQRAIDSIETVNSIRTHLAQNPGTKQNQLKKALAYDDGRYLSQLVKDMEHMGQLERQKSGNTYELYVVESQAAQKVERQISSPTETRVPPTPLSAIPKTRSHRWWQRRS